MNNNEFRKSMKENLNIKEGRKPEKKGVFKYDGVDKLLYENPTGDKKIGVSER